MTSQKKTNDDSPKGFAGLSSMVSDVGDVITSSEIKKPEVSNEEIINDSPKGFSGLVSMVSDVESMTEFQKSEPLEKKAAVNTNKSTTSTSPQQISENSSKNKNWIIVLGIIFGLIWLMSDSDKKSTTQHSTSTRPSEEKPPVGTNLTFNLAQIRYCLSEDIRMEGVKTVMDSYSKSDVDRFKGMIADYNSRCSQFHYRQGLLESAKRDVYPYRSVLELEGQGRFEHNISSKKQQLELGIKTYDSSSDATIIKLQNQSKKNTPIPLMGPKVSEVAENKKKSIVPNDSNVLSDARAMVIRMIDYALIDGGVKNESEIQKMQKRITALPKLTKTNVKEARDANNNGLALAKAEKYDEAVKFFENGNTLNPADIEIVGNLGFAYVKLNQLDSAQQAMMISLAMAPNRATAWANLGDVYALKNDKYRAVACLANAYRFSRNREKTHQFFKSLNEKENVEQLKQARNEAMTWADKTYFQVLKEDNKRNIWAEYKDTKTGFKISYPVNWVVKKIEEPKVKFFAAFKTDKEEGDCDVALIPNDIFLNMTQEDINRKLEGLPESDQPDWSKLSLAPEVNIKQIENRKFKKSDMLMYSATVEITSNKSEEKWTRKQNNTLTFTPGFIWAIHCGVSSNDANQARVRFTEFQPIFNDFLGSFSFLKH